MSKNLLIIFYYIFTWGVVAAWPAGSLLIIFRLFPAGGNCFYVLEGRICDGTGAQSLALTLYTTLCLFVVYRTGLSYQKYLANKDKSRTNGKDS